MAAPTTIKLPETLKERIAPLAEAAGKTAHAWMVEALERQAGLAEAREAFIRDAESAASDIDAGGALYAAEDVAAYLLARAAGKRSGRVRSRSRAAPRGRVPRVSPGRRYDACFGVLPAPRSQ
jgi:predicted transcriptional regulator